MYIKTATITNVRSIANLTWQIQEDQAAGWHVILGDNGAGKTAFVRSLALALIGPTNALALRQNWSNWLRHEKQIGQIGVDILAAPDYDYFASVNREGNLPLTQPLLSSTIVVVHKGSKTKSRTNTLKKPSATMLLIRQQDHDNIASNNVVLGWGTGKQDRSTSQRHVWGNNKGWFSASYGPFRRFSGGDEDFEDTLHSNPKLARHLTAFGENVALTETLRWLKELRFIQLENSHALEGQLLTAIQDFVNHDNFLPDGVAIKRVSTKGVEFVDGNGYRVNVEELSDGYRSILSLTFDLIRQLAICYGAGEILALPIPQKLSYLVSFL